MKGSLKMEKYLMIAQWIIFIFAILAAVACIPLFVFTLSLVYISYFIANIGIAIFVFPNKKREG